MEQSPSGPAARHGGRHLSPPPPFLLHAWGSSWATAEASPAAKTSTMTGNRHGRRSREERRRACASGRRGSCGVGGELVDGTAGWRSGTSSTIRDRSEIFQSRTKAAMDAIGMRWFAVVGVSYGGFVGYRMASMYPEAVDRAVLVCVGVCLEEGDLAAGLFLVAGIGKATELLVPRRPTDVRRLVRLTFVRSPPIMLSYFLNDYINVMGTDHIQEKTQLLHTLINDRKLSDLPKISQVTPHCKELKNSERALKLRPAYAIRAVISPNYAANIIIWGEQDQVFPLELAHRLERPVTLGSKATTISVAIVTQGIEP